MEPSSSRRAQADIRHFRTQLSRLCTRLREADDHFGGHTNLIYTRLGDAEQAFKRKRYRNVARSLNQARYHLQYVTGELVEPQPENQFAWRRWTGHQLSRCFRRHRYLKLAIALALALAIPMGMYIQNAIVVHDARDAVTGSLAGSAYASTSQVLTAAGLPSGYQFYTGKPEQIQKLRPGQMAWTDSSNIEGTPGTYGIIAKNEGVGSSSTGGSSGNNVNGDSTTGTATNGTASNSNTNQVSAPGSTSTGLEVLVVNTGNGFIGVAFQAGCGGSGSSPSGYSPSGFNPGDTPIEITDIPLACP